jgi:uncharacterized cupin superfamily protein
MIQEIGSMIFYFDHIDYFDENPFTLEWLEVKENCDKFEMALNLFNVNSGYMHLHKHHVDEYFKVVQGKCVYVVNKKVHIAKKGDEIFIPANTWHINPFNYVAGPIDKTILVNTNTPECLVNFYKF